MRTRVVLLLALALVWCAGAAHAQQMQSQPLTFVSDYYVHSGKEDDFMTLVKTVGQLSNCVPALASESLPPDNESSTEPEAPVESGTVDPVLPPGDMPPQG